MSYGIPLSDLPHGPAFWLPFIFMFGAMIGSFLNVAIYRLPIMLERRKKGVSTPPFNLAIPRSRCPCCGHPISALENIPILSWIFLRGQCRGCKSPIHWRYPLVELVMAVATTLVVLAFDVSWFSGLAVIEIAVAITLQGLDAYLANVRLTEDPCND